MATGAYALCSGRLCAAPSPIGLDLRHFPPAHLARAAALVPAAFLLLWAAAYHVLHRARARATRAALATALAASYLGLVVSGIPWHPFW
jgi:hypothetical protein